MLKACAAGIVLVLTQVALAAEPLPTGVKPDDPNLYYIGRFDTQDANGPRCQWPANSVVIRFNGTDLQMKSKDNGRNALHAIVDGGEGTKVTPERGISLVDFARGLSAGEHVVSITRRTEAAKQTSQILVFFLNDGAKLLPPKKLSRKIEIIGDLISCGYGNEAASEKERQTPENSNAAMTYGAIAAREVGAEYVCIAWSGRKMAPDRTMGEVYDRILPLDMASRWDFTLWTPDVVLINLSTNDFAKERPTEEEWTTAYAAFIERLRTNYRNATTYVATSPMRNDATIKTYLEKNVALRKAAGDEKVGLIHFPLQNMKADGLGAAYHPNIKTNQKNAKIFVDQLKAALKWGAAK
jgi:lysophospholipase L1-like esterase